MIRVDSFIDGCPRSNSLAQPLPWQTDMVDPRIQPQPRSEPVTPGSDAGSGPAELETHSLGIDPVSPDGLREALLEAALHYARRGWPVLPLHSVRGGRCSCGRDCGRAAGKHPRTASGVRDASADEAVIRTWWERWPDANLGVATGPASGLLVLDVDPAHGGDDSLELLLARHGAPPGGPISHTGGGGRHLLFAHPGSRVPSRCGALGSGLDVRSDGGYIVAPPSRHRSGRLYEWEPSSHPDEIPLPPAPPWLVEGATAAIDRPSRPAALPLDDTIQEGRRNETLTSLAGSMRRSGMTSDEIEAALAPVNARRCIPPLAHAELRTIARSVGRYPAASHRAAGRPQADEPSPIGWPLYDAAEVWGDPPAEPLVDALLPLSGVVWWGGPPKRAKSLLLLYLCLAIACGRPTVAGRFRVRGQPRILYVAREDGRGRFEERKEDILATWDVRPPAGALQYVIRPRLDLGDAAHVGWLRETCLVQGVTLLVLDTWTALSLGADPLSARDQAQLAATVVELCDALGGLVIVIDHTRKNRPEGQALSSADIHGPYVKWATAEHIVMQDIAAGHPRRFEVFVEGKDLEAGRFFLDVSPRGSGEEKFVCPGTAAELAAARQELGDENRRAVLEVLQAAAGPLGPEEVLAGVRRGGRPLGRATIRRHLAALVRAGAAERAGHGPRTVYLARRGSERSAQGPSERHDERTR
jgi:Bifunctional DNA primase/polymerase, N-terminal/AAA domain/Primase C terminal 1 (PriCT-1)